MKDSLQGKRKYYFIYLFYNVNKYIFNTLLHCPDFFSRHICHKICAI